MQRLLLRLDGTAQSMGDAHGDLTLAMEEQIPDLAMYGSLDNMRGIFADFIANWCSQFLLFVQSHVFHGQRMA